VTSRLEATLICDDGNLNLKQTEQALAPGIQSRRPDPNDGG
jgi:hypothetical protein